MQGKKQRKFLEAKAGLRIESRFRDLKGHAAINTGTCLQICLGRVSNNHYREFIK